MEPKIVFNSGGFGSIYFPPGKLSDGGTCEFANPTCLKECPEIPERNHLQVSAYKYITGEKVSTVTDEILKQLKRMDASLLYWFASGDCELKHIDQIFNIIKELSTTGIIQQGFTRNSLLWEELLEVENTRMALTVEYENVALYLSRKGLVAVPDYEEQRVNLYLENRGIWACGMSFGGSICASSFMDDGNDIHEALCTECLKYERGCFMGGL